MLFRSPVHQRHVALRRAGYLDLLRHRAKIRIQAWPRLRQRAVSRRNQPHHSEDAVRPARSHERGPGHRRRALVSTATTLLSVGHAESHRAPRNLSVAGVATRSFPDANSQGISRRQRRARDLARRSRRSPTRKPAPRAQRRRSSRNSASRSPGPHRRIAHHVLAEHSRQNPRVRISLARSVSPRLANALPRRPSHGLLGGPRLLHSRRFQAPRRFRLRPPRSSKFALHFHLEKIRASRASVARDRGERAGPGIVVGRNAPINILISCYPERSKRSFSREILSGLLRDFALRTFRPCSWE